MSILVGDYGDRENIAKAIDGFLWLDLNAKNGDNITDPKYWKVSKKFKYYE